MRKKYYLLSDLGYDGVIVEEIATKKEAEKKYTEVEKEMEEEKLEHGSYIGTFGVALVEGTVIKHKDFFFVKE